MNADVIGVSMHRIMDGTHPHSRMQRIRQALMTGPVMKTLVFLNSCATRQMASRTAAVTSSRVPNVFFSFILTSSVKIYCAEVKK